MFRKKRFRSIYPATAGYIVMRRTEAGEYKPTAYDKADAYVMVLTHYLNSRRCLARIEGKVLSGEAMIDYDFTSTRIESKGALIIVAKPGAVLRITKETGDYRGPCEEVVETKKLTLDESGVPKLVPHEEISQEEIA